MTTIHEREKRGCADEKTVHLDDGTRVRKTKELRREEILEAALVEFAELGLHGASVEDIARRAGISQPYVFRLFSTKKNLFKAVVARCFRETLEEFQRAAEGKSGREALDAIGRTHAGRLWREPERLRLQMQAFAACGDPELRDVVRTGVGDLVAYVDRFGGITDEESSRLFGAGLLVNLLAALHVAQGMEPWADRLVAACGSHLPRPTSAAAGADGLAVAWHRSPRAFVADQRKEMR